MKYKSLFKLTLGLDRQNVLYMPLEGRLKGKYITETFRQEVLRQPFVLGATTTSSLPINVQMSSTDLAWPGKLPSSQTNVSFLEVSGYLMHTMNVKLLAGRDFRTNSAGDSSNYIVNEATAKLFGNDNPVGKEVTFLRGTGRIIGLVKDFHLTSLHQKINPLILVYKPTGNDYLLIKAQAGQLPKILSSLERTTKSFNPDYPFTYHFLDEAYVKLYQAEEQVNTLVNIWGP